MSKSHENEHPVATIAPAAQEGAVLTPESTLEPELTEQAALKTSADADVVAAVLTKPVTEDTVAAAVLVQEEASPVAVEAAAEEVEVATAVVAKQSRWSRAFHTVTCGICQISVTGGSAVDYHNLVHTPTDEVGPILGDHDVQGDGKEAAHLENGYYVGTSSSAEGHHALANGIEHDKEMVQVLDTEAHTTFIEEVTIVDSGNAIKETEVVTILDREITAAETDASVTLLTIQEPTKANDDDSKKKGGKKSSSTSNFLSRTLSTAGIDIKHKLQSSAAGATSPPGQTRKTFKGFAKSMQRSTSATNIQTPSSPSSSDPTQSSMASPPSSTSPSSPGSPLAGIGRRFSKIIKSGESSSSVSAERSPNMTEIKKTKKTKRSKSAVISPAAGTNVSDAAISAMAEGLQAPQDLLVDFHETVMSDDDDDDHEEHSFAAAVISEEPQEEEVNKIVIQARSPPGSPVVPARRESLLFDAGSSPVTIPATGHTSVSHRNSQQSWAQASTLHQADASGTVRTSSSSSPGQSLALAGRTSTVGSHKDSETGSLGSSDVGSATGSGGKTLDEAGKPQAKRRASMMKNLKKITNIMKDKKGDKTTTTTTIKVEKRTSRQGSTSLGSPLEADENAAAF
ncbi:hypothetical protein BGZ98_000579 [Dissophora globulifera]|nr:hypothetical protein BGZ98_000579 [Dissophora globulifera]